MDDLSSKLLAIFPSAAEPVSVFIETWWNQLHFELQVFYGIGILALFSLLLQLVMTLFIGIDHDTDLPDGEGHGSGMNIFSIRGVTAFFLGFGWGGVIALKAGFGLITAITLGVIIGGFLMFLIFLLMASMLRLVSNGCLDYANAIGQIGTVYVTVPGHGKAGGQVELMLQGRLTMASAIFSGDEPLAPGTKVTVTEKIGTSTLIVEPLKS